MAFWGIEVKPGKPFTLKFDDGVRRRLHISQATLAIGSSKQTSLVQCNVGNKSPVLLCALLPDKSESLQLNLEFEEDEEVLFSVIGPRGVHLTGFYTGVGRNFNDDESESYGEDIANSENEGSVPQSDEDEYEDSFIDDDDNLEVLPPSPISADEVDDDIDKRRNKRKTNKRLKNSSQVVESDDETDDSWQQHTGNCIRSILGSESEDDFPISSVRKNKKTAKNIVLESSACGDASKPKVDIPVENDEPKRNMPKKKDKGASNEGKTLEADAANHSNPGDKAKQSEAKTNYIAAGQNPIVTNEIDDDPRTYKTMPKKKGKGASNEGKTLEADAANHGNPDDKAKQSEAKTNDLAVGQDPIVTIEIDDDPDTNKGSNLLPSPELGLESGVKPKKKRKERSKEERIPEANTDNHIKSLQENISLQADTGADDVDHNMHVGEEHDKRPFNNTETGLSADTLLRAVEEGSENKQKKKRRKKEQDHKPSGDNNLDVPERKTDENISEKATKKKKRKSKVPKKDENLDVPVSLKAEKEGSTNEVQENNVITGPSQVRVLSNGLVIEDLESSKSDGKSAAPGRKLKVQYTAKLKETGEIIDSNGKAPYRFRLGNQDVMEGWNVGLDGMRAGDKRRLVVPPSLGNGSRGTAENVPPDSWVIYDVELLSVH